MTLQSYIHQLNADHLSFIIYLFYLFILHGLRLKTFFPSGRSINPAYKYDSDSHSVYNMQEQHVRHGMDIFSHVETSYKRRT